MRSKEECGTVPPSTTTNLAISRRTTSQYRLQITEGITIGVTVMGSSLWDSCLPRREEQQEQLKRSKRQGESSSSGSSSATDEHQLPRVGDPRTRSLSVCDACPACLAKHLGLAHPRAGSELIRQQQTQQWPFATNRSRPSLGPVRGNFAHSLPWEIAAVNCLKDRADR
ncbi:hypothetical protein NDU88_008130 [Pleurodeles waltl]|uniref:Uncharacterized protein n=1 Tax=Pleurodeles waltl TaxID=8319 RepID=A0AAV7RTS4_PLEWA|nr:hypothetical protein NDU88_008130 [Pleurodeles waltl]